MRWQRRARLAIGLFAIVFMVVVAFAFKRRQPAAPAAPVPSDPKAIVQSIGGKTQRYSLSRKDVSVSHQELRRYEDGSSKLIGVTITSQDRQSRDRTFTVTANEGTLGQNESTIQLDGQVKLASSDGMTVRAEHATYANSDGLIQAPGPVQFSKGRMTGSGIGFKYDNARDVLSILEKAVVQVAPDEKGAGAASIAAASAVFAQRDKYVQLDGQVNIRRGGQVIDADAAVVRLSPDEKRIETLELHNHTRITGTAGGPGSLRALSGADMTLTYAPDGETLQHALIAGDATIQLAGEAGKAGREIAAKTLDIVMAPDGSTPIALTGRDAVQLTFPAEGETPARTIQAAVLDAKGEPGRGLTRALFTGGVQFRERGAKVDRAARSTTLEVVMKQGMTTIDEARFAHAVRFEEGRMAAQAATARYDLAKGTLQLSGSEPGALVPHVVNDQIIVDAGRIDVTLDGPQVNADGSVKSALQPAKKDPANKDEVRKMPSMLKADKPVNVLADKLAYDGSLSLATYTGTARLFQGDTTVKGDTITIDEKAGDLTAAGSVMMTTTREQTGKDKKKERVQSTATARDLKYEDGPRRLTYTGAAHMVGPEGDLTAARIELYLKPSGDELDRAEAYNDPGGSGSTVTLREQKRTTTGQRLTYAAEQETYVITGLPATVVDECKRETIGKTLTFVKATDTITVDGNQQIRTQTRGGDANCQ